MSGLGWLGSRALRQGSVRHACRVELDVPTRHAIQARTGLVRASRKATTGLNSQLAVVLDTDAGTVFAKGLPMDHPWAVRQQHEAMINPHVRVVAPRLLWHEQAAGWDLLAFEHIGGARHADSRPRLPGPAAGHRHDAPPGRDQMPGPAGEAGQAALAAYVDPAACSTGTCCTPTSTR